MRPRSLPTTRLINIPGAARPGTLAKACVLLLKKFRFFFHTKIYPTTQVNKEFSQTSLFHPKPTLISETRF